ncbi:MAG: gfo/Idh/MocA family oxidoreductase, partial [Bacteroidetes bacterium]|nr:gfo/Idh/MocA family oxidoreductase [Bacteroidota bacterium]
ESAMLIGTEGALLIPHQKMPVVIPSGNVKAYSNPTLAERNHYHHFVDACLGGEKTESHFAQSGPMTEAVLLGTVAIRVPGQLLKWDSARMKFSNYPAANQYLRRTYRKGWEVRGV